MNMNPFPDATDAEPIAITVWLTHEQFARLEAVTAGLCADGTCPDDNAATDYVFDAGMDLIELVLDMEQIATT